MCRRCRDLSRHPRLDHRRQRGHGNPLASVRAEGRAAINQTQLLARTAAPFFTGDDFGFDSDQVSVGWHLVAPQRGPNGQTRYTHVEPIHDVPALIDDVLRFDGLERGLDESPAVRDGLLQLHALQSVRRLHPGRDQDINDLRRRGWHLLSIK